VATAECNLVAVFFVQAVVNFGSSWCSHCHQLFPDFLKLTHVFPKLTYAVAQVDYMQHAVRDISLTPTIAIFHKGRKVDQFFGANRQQLRDRLWLHSNETSPSGVNNG
jgi:thioredoxin 1